MTARFLTIGLIIASLVTYQLSQRTMPTGTNPFSVVIIVYILGIAGCALIAPRVGRPIELSDLALLKLRPIWTLAVSVVGIELGYLLAYRIGWPLGTTTGITYTSNMVLLAIIGACFFAEAITLRRAAGLALAMAGVWLLVVPPRGH